MIYILFCINLHYLIIQFSPSCLICGSKHIFRVLMCSSSGISGKLMIQKGPTCHCLFLTTCGFQNLLIYTKKILDLSWSLVTGDIDCTRSYVLQFPNGSKWNSKCQQAKRPKIRDNWCTLWCLLGISHSHSWFFLSIGISAINGIRSESKINVSCSSA